MKSTKIKEDLQRVLKEIIQTQPIILTIIEDIAKKGGRALLVGGAVRDIILSILQDKKNGVKDLDIEVHGLTLDQLQDILEHYRQVSLVGKSFGVLRLHGLDIDWSLPRKDSSGRHPTVVIDPNMSLSEAFARRDLTINAMGIDLNSSELIDPWNGLNDLQEGILRATDPALFIEDPLRLFRVMQFIGRFAMKPDAQLDAICTRMSLKGISIERVEAEFDKLFLKSQRPSLGIRWLQSIGRLEEILPELFATIGVQQESDWHPEGDVFEHTMQSIDASALLSYSDNNQKLIAMYGVLCHDLGKTTTTQKISGRLRSLGHEEAGVPLAKNMLKRITHRKELTDTVAKLVRYHMAPGQFIKNGAKISAYKRLANKLAPDITVELLAKVSLADKRGRNPESSTPLTRAIPEIDEFIQKSQHAQVFYKPEEPILHGRDLMDIMQPGPRMGELLKKAYEIQIEQGITDKQELLKRILQNQ